MKKRTLLSIALAAIALPSLSHGQLAAYSQDFETLVQSDIDALANDNWLAFGYVTDSGGTYLYDYGPFGTPNEPSSPAFSLITAGEGGVPQGAQGLVVFSDYENADHGNASGNIIESSVFQEQTIGAGDLGTFRLEFDAKAGDLVSPSTAKAFVKIIDSVTFDLVAEQSLDMSAIPATWGTFMIDIPIDGSVDGGQILQFGFSNTAANGDASGVHYDNVNFSQQGGGGGLVDYKQDFEDYDNSTVTVLGDDGWLVFGNVSDSTGAYLYGYGTNPAPNNPAAAAFCLVSTGEGGVEQGDQGLVVFSDYLNGDHDATICNTIEANVFQEQIIGAGDFGTYRFQFDAKAGDLVAPSTAQAFVKILNPATGFSLTAFETFDTTNLPVTWGTYTIDVGINGALLEGQLLQFGFLNTASRYEASGVHYDNVCFTKFSNEVQGLQPYSQDFEGLNQASGSGLSDDGWVVFGNVFDPAGGYRYGYGVFPAPNNLPPAANFSYIWASEGGAAQGTQGMAVLGDYNNVDQDAGGLNSTVEANVFQEQTIAAGDLGTWCFQFDAKAGDLSGASTSLAFIKVLDPSNGFSLTHFLTVDTTSLPATWGTFSIDIFVDGAVLGGQLLQIGFLTQTNNFEPSTVFYDNVNFAPQVTTEPPLVISNITKTGNQADITFQSESGATYSLLQSTTLNGLGSFTPVAGQTAIPGTGGLVTASDTAATETDKYYLVQKNP